jgi:hypothetical protein
MSTTSISGSLWPSVAEKRTLGWFSVRTDDKEAGAACSPSEIAQLYAALLHILWSRDLISTVTDTAPKGGYYPTLCAMLDTNCREPATYLGNS